jgi:hypothetical protein
MKEASAMGRVGQGKWNAHALHYAVLRVLATVKATVGQRVDLQAALRRQRANQRAAIQQVAHWSPARTDRSRNDALLEPPTSAELGWVRVEVD